MHHTLSVSSRVRRRVMGDAAGMSLPVSDTPRRRGSDRSCERVGGRHVVLRRSARGLELRGLRRLERRGALAC